MYKMKVTSLVLGLLLFSTTSIGKIIIPLNKQNLSLNIDDSYKLKKKCDGHAKISCYEISNENVFVNIYISDLSENKFLKSNFKQICKSKIDLNKFKLKYCYDKQTHEIFFLKNKHLITISFKPGTKFTIKQIENLIGGAK